MALMNTPEMRTKIRMYVNRGRALLSKKVKLHAGGRTDEKSGGPKGLAMIGGPEKDGPNDGSKLICISC